MIRINYESEGFTGNGPVSNGVNEIQTSWNELLWAAVTVGRPNRQYVFKHGDASLYEALFRWSLVRMALEQRGPSTTRLRRTEAAKTLDPTEKGAVNYFLGMTFCKLFAAALLDTPWVLHLDVFRPQLDIPLKGRSRPDLIGESAANGWIVLESKGRISPPSSDAKNKAKQQAERVNLINGAAPSLHIGAVTYFQSDVLQFFWRDPRPDSDTPRRGMEIVIVDVHWRLYYSPVFDFIRSRKRVLDKMMVEPVLMPVKELDVEVGIHPAILKHLMESKWADARRHCLRYADELKAAGYQADGIRIVAGDSWNLPFEEFSESRKRM